jgi:malonyl-CoA/methylmalonyl-CoA synthetase
MRLRFWPETIPPVIWLWQAQATEPFCRAPTFPISRIRRTKPSAPANRTPEDTAALLYTSRTTMRAKGAIITQNNLLSTSRELTRLWRISRVDRLLHALPILHAQRLSVAMNTAFLLGAEFI